MEELAAAWDTLAARLASDAILVALAAWLGKIWATRIANRERVESEARLQAQRHQQDRLIEELRSALQAESRRIDAAVTVATSTFAEQARRTGARGR